MKTYDLYGTSNLTMSELRDRLAALLGIEFQERESSYRGGIYYRAGDLQDEHFVILANNGTEEEDLPEPDFVGVPVLLEVNATVRPDWLRQRLSGVSGLSLLRSTVI